MFAIGNVNALIIHFFGQNHVLQHKNAIFAVLCRIPVFWFCL